MGKVKNLIWDEIEFEPENMTPEHYRLKCGHSARRMAAELEISRQTWSKYENQLKALALQESVQTLKDAMKREGVE